MASGDCSRSVVPQKHPALLARSAWTAEAPFFKCLF